jgi:hypothetical protein
MTVEKENPIFNKKLILFSTSQIPLAAEALCVTFYATQTYSVYM